MRYRFNIRQHLAPCALALLLVSCALPQPAAPTPRPARPVPTLFPTAAYIATSPAGPNPSAATPAPDSGWQAGPPGVELRRLRVTDAPDRPAIPVTVVRLDPARVRLRVAYSPDRPRSLRAWFDEAHPLLAINGGFFHDDYRTAALLISDGMISGASYTGFGGMLAVAPDGSISLRALRDQPYDPDEQLAQAMQSFPMLVFPGGEPAALQDDGQRARRTAVALDRSGRVLLIVCPTSGFTLTGLAGWLAHSDLDVDRALNFDGGSSTGMYLKAGALSEAVDSLGPLPIVLLVEAR